MSNDAITAIRQRSERKYAACTVADAIHDVGVLLALLGTSNDALSMQQQRDQAVRECEQVRDALVLQGQEGGKLVRSLQDNLAAVSAERDRYHDDWMALSQDDGKVERALESKQAECDRLTQQVAATTAAYDRINGRCLGLMDQVDSIARFLDCGHCAIDIIAAVKSIRDERDAFTAALAEVRGESKEGEEIRSFVAHSRLLYEKHGYARALLSNQQIDTLLSVIDSLQLQEAASRNGFAQAKAREQGLRKRVDAADRCAAKLRENIGELIGEREDLIESRDAAESRVRELEKLCSTARDTLGYLADMHQLSPSDAMHVAELRSALAPPPPAIVAGEQPEHCTLIPGEQVKLCTDYPACACGGQP